MVEVQCSDAGIQWNTEIIRLTGALHSPIADVSDPGSGKPDPRAVVSKPDTGVSDPTVESTNQAGGATPKL